MPVALMPDMLKILHTADWQIGRQYGRFAPDDAVVLAEARYGAVERIAALANDEQVQAVLVAGDVFDAQTVSDRSIRRLFNALQAYAGPWFMIPGNHDAALAESVWSRALRLGAVPDNVHLLLEPQVCEHPESGLAILPAPLRQRHTYDDSSAWFDTARTSPGLLRIGLAHGSVQGVLAAGAASGNPIDPGRAASAQLDYLALGDWHGMKRINARTWYSGTPEQDRFRDNDAGHVLVVGLPGPGAEPLVTPHAISTYRWLSQEHQLDVQSDIGQLISALQALSDNTVLELAIAGHMDLAGEQQLQQALAVAAGRLRSLQCDLSGLRLVPSAQDIASLQADGYLGEVLAELQGGDVPADPAVVREALLIFANLLREQAAAPGPAEVQP